MRWLVTLYSPLAWKYLAMNFSLLRKWPGNLNLQTSCNTFVRTISRCIHSASTTCHRLISYYKIDDGNRLSASRSNKDF